MSFRSCEECWDNPCTCGYDYREWSRSKKIELVKAILNSEDIESILNEIKGSRGVRPGIEDEHKHSMDW